MIRVNSQSGKGGIAYLLETEFGVTLSRSEQVEFARHVQRHTDETGAEVSAEALWELFTEFDPEAARAVRRGGKSGLS
ncbi:hypothetical protein GCM10027089_12820 [Nocardia thraciensis]